MSHDVSFRPQYLQRAQSAYERGRAKMALRYAAWLLPLAALAVWLGHYRLAVCGFAVVGIAFTAFAAWRGREGMRAVVPGVLFGLVPFTFAHGARLVSHACVGGMHGTCTQWCVMACTAGGLVAGTSLVAWAHRFLARSNRTRFILYAAGVSGAIGAMGCMCVGSAGVAGLAIGLAASVGPGLVRQSMARL